jgi:hypothetical protein
MLLVEHRVSEWETDSLGGGVEVDQRTHTLTVILEDMAPATLAPAWFGIMTRVNEDEFLGVQQGLLLCLSVLVGGVHRKATTNAIPDRLEAAQQRHWSLTYMFHEHAAIGWNEYLELTEAGKARRVRMDGYPTAKMAPVFGASDFPVIEGQPVH